MSSIGAALPETFPAISQTPASLPLPRIGWGIFLLLVLVGVIVAEGWSASGVLVAGTGVAMLVALRFPYFAYYGFVASSLLLGWQVTVSTGALAWGEQVFHGAIEVSVAEVVALAVLFAWAVRVLLLWRGRRDREWRPWLPLFVPYLCVVATQMVSSFSAADPSLVQVFKYSLRPVLFVYLSSVLLTVNFVRSKRRLLAALGVLAVVGTWFAFEGLQSLFVSDNGLFSLQRARPLSFLGVNLLGGNHNSLAEVLLITMPCTLAYAALTRDRRVRAFAVAGAVFMSGICLLTFARSAWIALTVQLALLSFTVGRKWVKEHRRALGALAVLFMPLAAYMVRFSMTSVVQGSTDARAMITGVAWDLFRSSPWIGVGAGTFVDRLSHVFAYAVEFGAPIEAHGVLQKLGSETGVFGLVAFAVVMALLFQSLWQAWKGLRPNTPEATAFIFLVAGVCGAVVYQFFDTTYWTPRLWLPVGMALAAGRIFLAHHADRDPNFLSYD